MNRCERTRLTVSNFGFSFEVLAQRTGQVRTHTPRSAARARLRGADVRKLPGDRGARPPARRRGCPLKRKKIPVR